MSFLDFFKKKESSFQQPEPANNSSARDLSGVLDSVGVGLIVIDENDCLLELNESSTGYLGLSEKTIGNKSVEVIKNVDLIYDLGTNKNPCGGGTSTIVYNPNTNKVEKEYLSLAGTLVNCCGGITPWGTCISCEETVDIKGGGLNKNHG